MKLFMVSHLFVKNNMMSFINVLILTLLALSRHLSSEKHGIPPLLRPSYLFVNKGYFDIFEILCPLELP